MSRDDLKDILCRVIENLSNDEAPEAGCIFADHHDPEPCDVTTYYAVGEEG